MANNYLQFSYTHSLKTQEECDWVAELTNGLATYSPDIKPWVKDLAKLVGDKADWFDDDNPFGYIKFLKEEKEIWLVSKDDDNSEPYAAGLVLSAFLKQFYPNEIAGFEWASWCSKPRVGEFGGGAVVVTSTEVLLYPTHGVLEDAIEKLKRGEDL